MSFYQQSMYLLLSSYTFINTQKYQGYKSVLQLKKKSSGNSITIFLLYQLFIKKYVSGYRYKYNMTTSLILNIAFALISTYTYIGYRISKNIYWDLQKLWEYTLRSLYIL